MIRRFSVEEAKEAHDLLDDNTMMILTRRFLSTPRLTSRTFASEQANFTSRFLDVVREDLPAATDPQKSSELLRRLIRSDLLRFTDMRDEPEKFFLAHRLLSSVGLNGFGVRFTVQFNLFAGSILGLGGPDQVSILDDYQRDGTLGCFLLTEMQAGGETPASKHFVIICRRFI